MVDLSKKSDVMKVKYILAMHSQLKADRKDFEPLMSSIEGIFSPRSYNLLKDGSKITDGAAVYDSIPEAAKNKFIRGVCGYLVSRQPWWLRMTVAKQKMMASDKVKTFLDEYNEQLKYSFSQSNFYSALPHCVEDGITTGPGILVPEYDEIKHKVYYKPKSHWQVWIAVDEYNRPYVYHEELQFSAADALEKFGPDEMPASLVAAAEGRRGNPLTKYDFLYAIYKNPNYDADSVRPEDMKYIGYYICLSKAKNGKSGLCEELGRPWFPLCLRINAKHGFAYNTHRTMAAEALTESKLGNSLGKAKFEAAHKSVNPPLTGPVGLMHKINRNAGGYTPMGPQDRERVQMLAEQLNWPITEAEEAARNKRIEDHFFVRFFELLSQDDLPQMTAYQASQMGGEKAILMGPITEPIEEQILTDAAGIQAFTETNAGLMPDPPDELFEQFDNKGNRSNSVKLITEFDGPLTQLRRNLLTSKGTMTGLGIIGEITKIFPRAARKIKDLELLEDMSVESGAKQKWFRSDEEMEELDRIAAEQEAAQAEQEQMLEMAKVAPGIANTAVDPDSILSNLAANGGALQ